MGALRMSPRQLEALAREHLRYFAYLRPHGGFGGDWDSLEACAQVADEHQVGRVLALLGCSELALETGFHPVRLGDYELQLSARARAAFPPHLPAPEVRLVFSVWVTPAHITQAASLEAWLDQRGVPMRGARP